MNIHIAKNRYTNSLLVLMLGSAIAHMILLFLRALASGDWHVLNYIHILDIDWFVPGLLAGFGGDIVADTTAQTHIVKVLEKPVSPAIVADIMHDILRMGGKTAARFSE